jgi:hypothetical protein
MVEDMMGVTRWEALGSTSESDVSMAGVINMVGMKIRAVEKIRVSESSGL